MAEKLPDRSVGVAGGIAAIVGLVVIGGGIVAFSGNEGPVVVDAGVAVDPPEKLACVDKPGFRAQWIAPVPVGAYGRPGRTGGCSYTPIPVERPVERPVDAVGSGVDALVPRDAGVPEVRPQQVLAVDTKSTVRSVLRGAQPAARACAQRHHFTGTLVVHMGITDAGRVEHARIDGEGAGTPIAACVLKTLQALRFPAGQDVAAITIPFRFQDVE